MSTVWDEKPSSSSSALVSMPSTQKSTFNVVLKNMFGRLSPEERAALALQCAFRKHMAVRELAYLQRRERLILVMIAIEDEQAVRVQRAWREKVKKRADQVEMRAVLKLQSQLRGNMSRRIHLPEQKALAHRIRRAARCIQRYARVAIAKAYMKEQCRGIIEKQGRALNLFWRMEMVVWQERYVFLTDQALHYQKLTKQRLADTATTKAVRFCDVNKVTAQYEDCVLVLHCRQRSYKFLLPSPADCETWANNVLQLVNLAGARACEVDELQHVVRPGLAVGGRRQQELVRALAAVEDEDTILVLRRHLVDVAEAHGLRRRGVGEPLLRELLVVERLVGEEDVALLPHHHLHPPEQVERAPLLLDDPAALLLHVRLRDRDARVPLDAPRGAADAVGERLLLGQVDPPRHVPAQLRLQLEHRAHLDLVGALFHLLAPRALHAHRLLVLDRDHHEDQPLATLQVRELAHRHVLPERALQRQRRPLLGREPPEHVFEHDVERALLRRRHAHEGGAGRRRLLVPHG